ncbi:MAG: GNAT family N-acetyltransferase [Saprospiraceae bacterium]|nr:GNAT family N-acetyltransferase [Saprospiraceae bacterium]
MEILPYLPEHKQAVLDIFQANVPEHFAQEEIDQLAIYLDKSREDFFVLQGDEGFVGAGGINYNKEDNYAVLSWAAVHPVHQRKGYGSLLTRHRLKHIVDHTSFPKTIVRTSQTAYQFYQKMGFELQYTKEDFWAKGFDLYYMTREMNR